MYVLKHSRAPDYSILTLKQEYWIIAQGLFALQMPRTSRKLCIELCIGSLAQFLQLAHAASAPEVHKHDSILPFAEEHCIVYGLQLLSGMLTLATRTNCNAP